MKFIHHPRFWLPFVALACIELLFRAGVWESLAKPNSYAGTSVANKRAATRLGLDAITGITLGDSRTVYGFDHRQIHDELARQGQFHVSLARGGSHLAGLKAMADWALKNMPNLNRLVIGVAPGSMNRIGNGSYEVALVEPFRDAADYWQLLPHFPPTAGDLRSLGSFSAVMAYREDIVDYLRNPRQRHTALATGAGATPLSRLTFANRRAGDLCKFDLTSLAACRLQVDRLTAAGESASPAARTFAAYCQRPRNITPPAVHQQALAQWIGWLRTLSVKVEVIVVLLPEHSLLALPSDREAAHKALAAATGPRLRLLDLSDLFAARECSVYSDLVHANQAGSQLATGNLLDALNATSPAASQNTGGQAAVSKGFHRRADSRVSFSGLSTAHQQ